MTDVSDKSGSNAASGDADADENRDVAVREVVERHVKSDVRPEHLPSIAPS